MKTRLARYIVENPIKATSLGIILMSVLGPEVANHFRSPAERVLRNIDQSVYYDEAEGLVFPGRERVERALELHAEVQVEIDGIRAENERIEFAIRSIDSLQQSIGKVLTAGATTGFSVDKLEAVRHLAAEWQQDMMTVADLVENGNFQTSATTLEVYGWAPSGEQAMTMAGQRRLTLEEFENEIEVYSSILALAKADNAELRGIAQEAIDALSVITSNEATMQAAERAFLVLTDWVEELRAERADGEALRTEFDAAFDEAIGAAVAEPSANSMAL